MQWTSAVSDAPSLTDAIEQACDQVSDDLGGSSPDLILAFISSHHSPSFHAVPELMRAKLGSSPTLGCSAAGVIGAGHEVERRPGVAVAAAHMPDVDILPFHFRQDELPSPDDPPEAWQELIGIDGLENPAFIIIPEPFTIQADLLLSGLDYAYPKSVKIGGLASGGNKEGENALFVDTAVHRSGAIGVALTGNVTIETLVAQGCRPIGQPMVITKCDRNIVKRLDDQTPLEVLRGIFDTSDERGRRLIRRSLQVGLVMDPLAHTFVAGDFLIRNVMGANEEDGSLAVGEVLREGQVVQFHVRDSNSASDDLRDVLERYQDGRNDGAPASALIFQCLGRGQYLFGVPDHDTDLFQSIIAPVPLTGFFCNGEIGQVGGSTFLHGYTSSFALFRPKSEAAVG